MAAGEYLRNIGCDVIGSDVIGSDVIGSDVIGSDVWPLHWPTTSTSISICLALQVSDEHMVGERVQLTSSSSRWILKLVVDYNVLQVAKKLECARTPPSPIALET